MALNCERCGKRKSQFQICEPCWLDYNRLKEGELTEPELQNLCHNLGKEDQRNFEDGCIAYQKKLFGCSNTELEIIGLRNRVRELEKYEHFYKMMLAILGVMK